MSGNLGQISGSIIEQHKGAIEKFIMVGYGRGWDQCDIIADPTHAKSRLLAIPHLIIDIQNLKDLEPIAYSSSHCLLMTYNVKNEKNLETLIKFGKSVILKKRLALVLKLSSNITLDAIKQKSMPILVAAELHNRRVQFLCPAVGEDKSEVQEHMCGQEYTSYKNKVLRIGMLGMPPYLKVTNAGKSIEGIDFDLLQLHVKWKNFVANITIPKNLFASISMVCIIELNVLLNISS